MTIKNLEQVRRLPRLGKIRLGEIVKKAGKKEYPKETGFYILDPQAGDEKQNGEIKVAFAELYGDKPVSIDVLFPVESELVFFPQFYKAYKGGGGGSGYLFCKGDGRTAVQVDDEKGGMVDVECPGEECPRYQEKKCRRIASLQVLLPKLPGVGCYQINTTSRNSIININSAVDMIRAICGRVSMIPLKLDLIKTPTQNPMAGKGAPKVTSHYILNINVADMKLGELQLTAQTPPEQVALPAPDETRDELLSSAADDDEPPAKPEIREPQKKTTAESLASNPDDEPKAQGEIFAPQCSQCNHSISRATYEKTNKKYGRPYCGNHEPEGK